MQIRTQKVKMSSTMWLHIYRNEYIIKEPDAEPMKLQHKSIGICREAS